MPSKRETYSAKDLKDMPVSDYEDEENPVSDADVGQMEQTKGRPRDPGSQEGRLDVEPGFTTTGPSGSSGGRALYGMKDVDRHEPTDVEDESDT